MSGHVTIVHFNPNAHQIVSAAGRISTTPGSAGDIYRHSEHLGEEKNSSLIQKILSSGHLSVLEHISLNLSFENVSVYVEQFMIEFRLASFTVKSRRYVDFSAAGYHTPDFSTAGAGAIALEDRYRRHTARLFETYKALIEAGVPKEDARFVLPYSFHSNFYCTVNGRELIHIMNEMVYGRGRDFPELAALGESLFTQCEACLPYLARRLPERYAPAAPVEAPLPHWCEKLSAGLVSLLSGPRDPVGLICQALLLPLSSDGLSPQQRSALLDRAMSAPRQRALEQAGFTLCFHRLSLAALTHLTRHRMQALVVPELLAVCRYDRYLIPPSVRAAGRERDYRDVFLQTKALVEDLLRSGMGREESVYLLLSGMSVPAVTTMNAHELSVFFQLRTCTRAQWEIRDCAVAALHLLRSRYPELFARFGPSCYMTGRCPEGAMTCGRQAEMEETFRLQNGI